MRVSEPVVPVRVGAVVVGVVGRFCSWGVALGIGFGALVAVGA